MTLNFEHVSKQKCKRAVLMFHGMTGSPFELKKFGKYLSGEGFDVYAECLPGHGDRKEEIYTVKYREWIDYACERFKALTEEYEEVFVSGLCLGAVLSLAIAEKYPKEVKGIISLSTTLYLDGWRLPWYAFLMPVGLNTIFRYYYTYPECEPYGIKNVRTRNIIKSLLEKSDVGLDNYPMSAIHELLELSKEVISELEQVTAPILIVHSREDDLTSIKSAECVFDNISSTKKELVILEDSYHMVLYDNEKEFVFEKSAAFLHANSDIAEGVAC